MANADLKPGFLRMEALEETGSYGRPLQKSITFICN